MLLCCESHTSTTDQTVGNNWVTEMGITDDVWQSSSITNCGKHMRSHGIFLRGVHTHTPACYTPRQPVYVGVKDMR